MALPLAAAIALQAAQIGGDFAAQGAQNRTNRKMAEYEYSKNLEMWNRANEYNTPEKQMLRLRQAGLNPNMVYGQGTVTGNVSGQLPRYQAPTAQFKMPAMSMPDEISKFQNVQMNQVQIDNMRMQTALMEQDTISKKIENQLKVIRGEGLGLDVKMKRESFAPTLEKTQQEALQSKVRTGSEEIKQAGYREDVEIKRQILQTKQTEQQIREQELIFKQYENALRALGITSSDNVILRALIQTGTLQGMLEYLGVKK